MFLASLFAWLTDTNPLYWPWVVSSFHIQHWGQGLGTSTLPEPHPELMASGWSSSSLEVHLSPHTGFPGVHWQCEHMCIEWEGGGLLGHSEIWMTLQKGLPSEISRGESYKAGDQPGQGASCPLSTPSDAARTPVIHDITTNGKCYKTGASVSGFYEGWFSWSPRC